MRLKGLLRIGREPLWTMPIALAVSGFVLESSALAASTPVTFAQVIESAANSNPSVFAYLNNGTNAELGTDVAGVFGASVPVDFTYLAVLGTPLAADLSGVQDATITLTSSTATPASTAVMGIYGIEPIDASGPAVNILKITRDTPAAEGAGSRTNLLTMIFTGTLLGAIGGETPQLSGNSALGNTVTYSSDFVSFAQSTQQDFSMTFSSWGPANPPPPGLSIGTGGFFNPATAAGTSTFDFEGAATVIPEPSAVWLFTLLVLPLAATHRRGRRQHRGLKTAAI
jgi:hypothetical protein